MRLTTSYHLLAFVAFVAATVSAVPLSDVSHTSVDVDAAGPSIKSDSPRFRLTVHRTDDLVDEKAGTLVAERQVEIQMDFDVSPAGDEDSLLLNGVPVKAGIERVKVQMQAGMVINRSKVTFPDGTINHEKEEEVKSAFDVGLVTVEVAVHASSLSVQLDPYLPPIPIRRFSLAERVVELDGKSVVQTDIGEQVFYFGPGGEFVGIVEDAEWAAISREEESSSSPVAAQNVQQPSSTNCRLARVRSSFKSWFKSLPSGLKYLIGFAWVTAALLWGMFVCSSVAILFRRTYKRLSTSDDEEKAAGMPPKDAYSYEKVKELEAETVSFGNGLPRYDSAENVDKVPGGGDSENDELCK